jgi:hypothetical protein
MTSGASVAADGAVVADAGTVSTDAAAVLPVVPGFQGRRIEGWKVYLSDELMKTQATETEAALTLLRPQLAEIVRMVPPAAVAKLQAINLWFSPEYPQTRPRAEYHPGLGWLRQVNRNPCLHKGVEFTNVRIFAAECQRMPSLALHELAHGYHDQVLGFDNADILAAYQRAKASGTYDQVERWHGNGRPNTREKAYAMSTVQEYFAECSEAYFGRNDFYPFNRADLHQHDPAMEQLLERLWTTGK